MDGFGFGLILFVLLVFPAFLPLFIKPPKGPNRFQPAGEPRSFGQAISTCLNKYANFKGRATRSEYWWFYLFLVLISVAAGILDLAIWGDQGIGLIGLLVSFGMLVPTIAVTTRRLHDRNRSGWWQLIGCGLGAFVIFYWLVTGPVEES